MKNGSLLHKIWWHYSNCSWAYLPMWLWRPYCWIVGRHENDCYNACVFCRKDLDP